MQKLILLRSHIFHLLVFIVFAIGIFNIKYNAELWVAYGDSWDYLYQAEKPLTSPDLYSPKKIDGRYPRPFITPLVFKAGLNLPNSFLSPHPHERISILHKTLHCLASLLFVIVFLQYIRKDVLKCLFIVLIYSLLSSWDIVGWTVLLVSESINSSVFILWLASLLFFIRNFSWGRLVLFLAATFILIFTRDTWSYVMLFFIILFSVIVYISYRKYLSKLIVIFVSISIFYVIQQNSAQTGERYRLPLYHSLVSRVIDNPKYLKWFKDEGMPCADLMRSTFSPFDANNDQQKVKIFNTYNDSLYKPLFKWILNGGKEKYTKFLITHPAYFFLLKEKKINVDRIFKQDLHLYLLLPNGMVSYFSAFFPIHFLIALFLSFTSCIIFFRKREPIYLIPVVLVLMAYFNVLLTYNADTLEPDRHFYITTVIIQIAAVMSTLITIDHLWKNKKQNITTTA